MLVILPTAFSMYFQFCHLKKKQCTPNKFCNSGILYTYIGDKGRCLVTWKRLHLVPGVKLL